MIYPEGPESGPHDNDSLEEQFGAMRGKYENRDEGHRREGEAEKGQERGDAETKEGDSGPGQESGHLHDLLEGVRARRERREELNELHDRNLELNLGYGETQVTVIEGSAMAKTEIPPSESVRKYKKDEAEILRITELTPVERAELREQRKEARDPDEEAEKFQEEREALLQRWEEVEEAIKEFKGRDMIPLRSGYIKGGLENFEKLVDRIMTAKERQITGSIKQLEKATKRKKS